MKLKKIESILNPENYQSRNEKLSEEKIALKNTMTQIDEIKSYENILFLLWGSKLPCGRQAISDKALLMHCSWKGMVIDYLYSQNTNFENSKGTVTNSTLSCKVVRFLAGL